MTPFENFPQTLIIALFLIYILYILEERTGDVQIGDTRAAALGPLIPGVIPLNDGNSFTDSLTSLF